ncbi:MAG: LamG domain-containing protein [Chloroflexales bacterium]|nr:LamG domain-containing protein [Chloroflexales bacterium]
MINVFSAIRQLSRWFWLRCGLILLCLAGTSAVTSYAQEGGYSLRFYGSGTGDIDRVKIPLDNPPRPVDVGGSDFTLEFWMKASAAENPAEPVSCGANDNWIYGNIIFDRDRFSLDRKFGLSIAGGVVVFGVTGIGDDKQVICGTTTVLDQQWHHIAVQRRVSDGRLWLYVDGKLDAETDGPDGDISYPDGAAPSEPGGDFCQGPGEVWRGRCVNEPYLIIGAEKHDVSSEFPSYSGWLDEVRISNVLRYDTAFISPGNPFTPDANTVALYHFDEGDGNTISDSANVAGGPSNGERRAGGPNNGPEWSADTPFAPGVLGGGEEQPTNPSAEENAPTATAAEEPPTAVPVESATAIVGPTVPPRPSITPDPPTTTPADPSEAQASATAPTDPPAPTAEASATDPAAVPRPTSAAGGETTAPGDPNTPNASATTSSASINWLVWIMIIIGIFGGLGAFLIMKSRSSR